VSAFLRRPPTERATSTVVHREFIVAKNLKLIQSSLVRQFSRDSIQTSPNESNLKLDVILAYL
jgi:hypothetical protein